MRNPLPLICIVLPALLITFGITLGALCQLGVVQ